MEKNASCCPPPAYDSSYPPVTYPPGTYPPETYPPNPPNNTIIITTPPVIMNFGPTSQCVVCPHCHNSVTTRVENEASTKTHLWAVCLCVCFGCLCCWIPYCVDSCQSQNHYCPHCNAFLGKYDN